jgi:hypothetical protein
MDVFLFICVSILMIIAVRFAVSRRGGRRSYEPLTEEEEDDLDDDEIDYWISKGWEGQGPPPGPF